MKRFPVVIGATVAGVAGILSFHTTNSAGPLSNALGVGPKGGANAGGPRTANPTNPPGRASSGSRSGGATPAGSGSGGSTTNTTAPPASAASASATGASEQYGYGALSVKVTVRNSKIVDVQLSNLQTAETYSQSLAQQVVPYLRRQVLARQSARIDGISGATYTSQAYALSVQSALDQLHFK